jgi:phosphoribosyl 1,2-cyclic phosphodiesterase
MLAFSVLSSGSKGNSIFITDNTTSILLDCGLSYRQLAQRLNAIGRNISELDAVLISHEHRDHTAGLAVLVKKQQIPVYASDGTFGGIEGYQDCGTWERVVIIPGQEFMLGSLRCETFNVLHDAADPIGLRVGANGVSLGVVTDCGRITSLVKDRVQDLDALILESNHDPDMLMECRYPWTLKQRIRSHHGHLSNDDACALIEELSEQERCRLKVVVAAHISENANRPELALDRISQAWRSEGLPPEIVAADVYRPTPLVTVYSSHVSGLEQQ